jgi:hypothetical protein
MYIDKKDIGIKRLKDIFPIFFVWGEGRGGGWEEI